MEIYILFAIFLAGNLSHCLDNPLNITSQEYPGCLSSLPPPGVLEWQDNLDGSYISVEWGYGNHMCSTESSCFGKELYPGEDDLPVDVQLFPVQIQKGVQLRFFASHNMDMPFSIKPYKVEEEDFKSCNHTFGTPVTAKATASEIIVPQEMLTPGENLFIVTTGDPLFRCDMGLRLNVTVKERHCAGVGEQMTCWNKGRCYTNRHSSAYTCLCCQGYTGIYCEDKDACVSQPCQHGGSCIDMHHDITGTRYTCRCPFGYHGDNCEKPIENLCEVNPCQHNATCIGSATSYECLCRGGYMGTHCEVDVNECHSNPCIHGNCVDYNNGYKCLCNTGYHGIHCESRRHTCHNNFCENSGICVESSDGQECDCPRGYTGRRCEIKVDLCSPTPCTNAEECIDYGAWYSCTCHPGFTGTHCEVNINECESNPCLNGGSCYDGVAAYVCMCTADFTGAHCEYPMGTLASAPPETVLAMREYTRSAINSLNVIAGTLAGSLVIALLVLGACYCRNSKISEKLQKWKPSSMFSYNRQIDDEDSQKRRDAAENAANPRLSVSAIMEATTPGYRDNTLNDPLVSSLKPKRV